MTNTYNTLNPLGSVSAKDLSDNASNFDEGMNSESPSFYDRFLKRRETWAGMEKMVSDFLEAMGFEATHLVYVDGTPLTVLRPTQLIDRSGSVYKVKMPASFPVNLTGTWATDQLLLVDVGDASLRALLAGSTGFQYVKWNGGAASEVPVSIDTLLLSSVNVKRFGAVCDGVADDTAAVQAAIDYCATFADWPALEVPGPCRLTASLNIDRLVDTTTSEFRIFGTGARAGFYTTANIIMFDSTIVMVLDPKSEFITFQNIAFVSNNIATAPKVLSPKFLRMKFLNCYFKFVKLMENTFTYVQSFYLTNCNIRTWPGVFLFATHAFDVDFNGCISEFGNGYICDFQNGCYSVRLRGGVHEGSVGGLISTGNAESLHVGPYYFEANAQPSLQFNAGSPNDSIVVIGCFFGSSAANIADTSFYEIVWGNTRNAVSIGCRQNNGRLHDNGLLPATANAPRMVSQGDSAAIAVAKQPLYLDESSGTFPLQAGATSPTINSATYRRNGNIAEVEFSITFSGTSGSSVELINLPYASANSIFGGSVIYSDLVGEIVLIGGLSIGASATSVLVCKDKQATPYTYTELNGKTIVGRIEYQI